MTPASPSSTPNSAAAPSARLRVCVYCGSRHGLDARFTDAARQIGTSIGERGWELVYGGGNVGLMGEVANATLAAGGTAIGVIPRLLQEKEVGHIGLTELHVVDTMHQRKQLMAERSDVFVALPGGIGTMEELFEVWTWRHIGYHDQPIGLLNVDGFYDGLIAFLQTMSDRGFVDQTVLDMLTVDDEPTTLLTVLSAKHRAASGRDDYSRI